MGSFNTKTESIDNNSSGGLVPLNDVTGASVQIVNENTFDGDAILEVTNDRSNWAEATNPATGVADVPINAVAARIRTTGTQGNVKVTWQRQYI